MRSEQLLTAIAVAYHYDSYTASAFIADGLDGVLAMQRQIIKFAK